MQQAGKQPSEDAGEVARRAATAQRFKLVQFAVGIFFFFIQYGRLQDRILRFRSSQDGSKFSALWLLQALDALANVVVGGLGRAWTGGTLSGLPQHQLLLAVGSSQVLAKHFFNVSLASGLSFHIATLAKSAKMIPIMIASLLFGGQASYSARTLAQAAAIVGGTSLVSISEGGGGKGGQSSPRGLSFVAAALTCDGLVGGVQGRLKAQCKEEGKALKPYDLMFWSNLYMMLAALIAAMLKRELRAGLAYLRTNPEILQHILRFSICGAFGQACVFQTVAASGPITVAAITTSRKLASVLLSMFETGVRLSPLGWFGLTAASTGLLGEIYFSATEGGRHKAAEAGRGEALSNGERIKA